MRDEFRRLDALLDRAVVEFRNRRSSDSTSQFRGLYISDREIDGLMTTADETLGKPWVETESRIAALRGEIQRRVVESQGAGVFLRVPHLSAVFGLSPLDTDLLLLALAPEFDPRYQKLYAYLQDDVGRKRPSIDLALRLFCVTLHEHVKAREFFADGSPLLTHSLLALYEEPGEHPAPLLNRSIKIDDRIGEFLLGSDRLDQRLTESSLMARWVTPRINLRDLIIPEDMKALLDKVISVSAVNPAWCCLLHGPAGVGKKSVAEAICHDIGRPLLIADLSALLKSGLTFQTLLRVAFREARLYGSAIYLDGWQELLQDEPGHLAALRAVEQEIERFPGPTFIGSRSPWRPSNRFRYRFVSLELPLPHDRLRRELWEAQLNNGTPEGAEIDTDHLASAFRFTAGQIRQAIAQAEAQAWLRQGEGYQLSMDD